MLSGINMRCTSIFAGDSGLTEVKKSSDVACSQAVIFRRRASRRSWKYLKSRQAWYVKMLLGDSLGKAWFLPTAVTQNKLGKVNYSIIGFNLAGNEGMVAASTVSQTARLASLGKLTQAQGKWKNTLCLGLGKGRTPTSINDDSSFAKAKIEMLSQGKD